MTNAIRQSPRTVAVLGAGVVGLSTAWFLQEHGVEVTVIDRGEIGAAASWGNAGWLTPALAGPLPEPAVLPYALKTALRPSSPIYIPPTMLPQLAGFLLTFARNCTHSRWERGMRALAGLNARAFDGFDELASSGVVPVVKNAEPFIAAYRTAAEALPLITEIETLAEIGGLAETGYQLLDGPQARAQVPALSGAIGAAVRIKGQRFVNPGELTQALAESIRVRGGSLRTNTAVHQIEEQPGALRIAGQNYDAAVLATGTWLGELGRHWGVRRRVVPGRGYSFTIPDVQGVSAPLYFPAQRVACTPIKGGLRVAGMMEFRAANAALDRRRIRTITDAVQPLFQQAGTTAVDFSSPTAEWVGSRPCTADGLPLIGASQSERIFVAGGHGMWGVTFGPTTGKLLAEQIATGRAPEPLKPFNPLR